MSLKKYKDNKNKCCECRGCEAICPKNAIYFISNEIGFTEPIIDKSKCIECDLCDRICNIGKKQINNNFEQKAYMHINNSAGVLKRSSSGGAFQSIIETVYKIYPKTVVYGAELTRQSDGFRCKHTKAYNFNDCLKFSGSKYIKSDIKMVFQDIIKDYNDNYFIVFSGLPCQIIALKNFLSIKNIALKNFLFIDLICHGVASTDFFNKLIFLIESKYKSKVIDFKFRDKNQGWRGYPVLTILENGKQIKNTALLRTFPILFLKGIIMRKSCFDCQYSTIKRNSDITLGDFWGDFEKEKKYKDGVSLIITNTKAGEIIVNTLKKEENFLTREVDILDAIKNQNNLVNGHKKPQKYDQFWKDYNKLEFQKLLKKYGNYNFRGKTKAILKKVKKYFV